MKDWEPVVEDLMGIHKTLRDLSLKTLSGALPTSQNALARLYFAVGNTRHHLNQLAWQLEELHSRIEKLHYVEEENGH